MLGVKELKEISADDCNLYYGGTYIRRSPKGKNNWAWMHVSSFLGHGDLLQVVVQKNETMTGEASMINEWDWDFSLPEARLYNFRGHTVSFHRTAYRQNRKALCSETMAIYDIFHRLYRVIIPSEIKQKHCFQLNALNLNLLLQEMQPIPPEKSLLAIMKQQALSRALNGNIALSQGILSKNPTLWYQAMPIGEFSSKKDEVILKVPDFAPEVEELFNSIGIPVTVH